MEHDTWEAPLHAALHLAPSKREPERFLTASYLEIWPALTTAKRMLARGLRAVIQEYETDEDEIEAEMVEIQAILARGGGGNDKVKG